MADQDINIVQTQLDVLDTPLVIPANKLDADQYMADDLDGVTESIFGSGNMAYASLQASQTDAALGVTEDFMLTGADAFASGSVAGGLARGSAIQERGPQSEGNNNSDITDTDRPFDGTAEFNGSEFNGSGNFTSSTVGSVSASQLASDAGSFASSGSPLSLNQGSEGTDGTDGSSGFNGETPDVPDVPGGNDGSDGKDGIDIGVGDTTINIDLGDTLGDIIDNIDNIFMTDLGDTITTLSTTVTDITSILNDLDINNLSDLTEVTNLVNDFTENLTENITNTLTDITNITDNVTNILEGVLGDDLHLTLGANLLDSLTGSLDTPLSNVFGTEGDAGLDLGTATNLANNLADMTGLDVVSDTLGDLGGAVETLQSNVDQLTSAVSDADLTEALNMLSETATGVTASVDEALGGLLEDIGIGDDIGETLDGVLEEAGLEDNLDEVIGDVLESAGLEDALGGLLGGGENADSTDTDVTAETGIEALDSLIAQDALETITNPLEDLAGDIDLDTDLGIDLLGESGIETSNAQGDSDITAETNIDLIDNTIGEITTDIPLDPIEGITGDIDLDVGSAIDFLGDIADPVVNDGEGGAGEDTILAGIGDELSGTTEDVIGESGLDIAESLDVLGGEDLTGVIEEIAGGEDLTGVVEEIAGGEGLTDVVEEIAGGDALDVSEAIDGLGGEDLTETVEDIIGGDALDVSGVLGLLGGGDSDDAGDVTSSAEEEGSWTESTIEEGGLFDDIAGGLGGGLGDVLPDPSGSVGEGLGVLDVEPEIDLGSLGGLFG